ncbi:MAG: hypothetical protein WB902_14705 [Acetobacteraceae bacterium]
MRWLGPIFHEIFGLFVDDGRLALIILGWLSAVALLLPQVPVALAWRGVALFAGLAIILVWSCLRHIARLGRHT